MQALGLIETRGLVSAVECADVMLKTAQVELVARNFVGGGLVTIIVTGDVGAVKAAVEAGVTAVEKLGKQSLIAQHVIPRPHQEMDSIIVQPLFKPSPATEAAETDTSEAAGSEPAQITLEVLCKASLDAAIDEFGLEKSMNLLKSISVERLRNLAREYKTLGIAGRSISKANKELLNRKLQEYYKQELEK